MTEKCYALLERLRRNEPTEALHCEWDSLWRDWAKSEHGEALDKHSAGLVYLTGWTVAMAADDPRSAAGFMDAYFRNPALDADNRETRVSFRCYLAFSLLCAGDDAEAACLYRLLIASKRRDSAKLALATARNQLFEYCRERPGEMQASEGVAVLVRDIASRMRRKRSAGLIEPGESSFKLLAEVLESTYPMRVDEGRSHE